MLQQAREIRRITRKTDCLFIVNNHPDIALAAEADGVHLGQDDMPTEAVRRILGPDFLIGRSTHSLDQALAAEGEEVDYIGYGPLFQTPTKPDYPPVGTSSLREVLNRVHLPVVAIGGINMTHVKELASMGVANLAMVREFAVDTRRRISMVNRMLSRQKR
jgi:thiamine-phosphate pyrophosphorylase